MENCVEIKECIACGNSNLVPLLDLGIQPLANSFLKSPDDEEESFPLATNYCKHCYHVQLTHKVNPDLLFKNYLYVSGTAQTQLKYFDWFARYVIERYPEGVRNVLDIGCNDGSQLDAFKVYGVKTYGVDPAENLYEKNSKNHSVVCGYFDENVYLNEQFDVVVCQNAFAHNYDQLAFLKNMGRVVNKSGYIFITTSQADMVIQSEFDTIYHEHLSFYNIQSMRELCERAGLFLIDAIKHPIHGNSFIFTISKDSNKQRPAWLELLCNREREAGLYDDELYEGYKIDCEYIIQSFSNTVKELRSDKKIVGYGAPAKGNTLLNAAYAKLDFIIDDNPLKQGLYTPGMHIPVFGSEKLNEYADEDLIFVPLAWNFFDEIRKKITTLRPNRNDLFLKTYPVVYLESAND